MATPVPRRAARRCAPRPPAGERGLAFIGLLIVVAALGAALGATATFWHTAQQRVKESELLFIGLQYRNAIRQYYHATPVKAFPRSLDALLRDERLPGTRRYLRRPYRDPLTGSAEWGLITAPDGGIMGIYSLAPGQPLKEAGFPAALGWSGGGRARYADWQFVYLPPSGELGF